MYELTDIKKLRKRVGLSQHELATRAGVSQSLLAKIETGKISPGYERVKRILSILNQIAKKKEIKAGKIATKKVISAAITDTITSAIKKMSDYKISQMPVMDKGKPVGLLTETGLLEKISSGRPINSLVMDVMEGAPPTVSEDSGLEAVVGLLKHFSLVIVTNRGEVIGVITKSDILSKLG